MKWVPALSRGLDPSFATNRFILVATPAIGTVVGLIALIRGESLPDSAWWGFYAGGSAFLGWAISVELHPDRPWVGALATLLAPIGLIRGTSALMVSAAVLLAVRAVAGTTGRSLRMADLVLLGVVAGGAVSSEAAPAALASGAVGLGATALWHDRRRGFHVAASGLYAVAAVVSLVLADGLERPPAGDLTLVWVGVGVGLISLLGPRRVAVSTDRSGGTIDAPRVRVARLISLVAAAAVSLTVGPAPVAPLWAATVAIAVMPR